MRTHYTMTENKCGIGEKWKMNHDDKKYTMHNLEDYINPGNTAINN